MVPAETKVYFALLCAFKRGQRTTADASNRYQVFGEVAVSD